MHSHITRAMFTDVIQPKTEQWPHNFWKFLKVVGKIGFLSLVFASGEKPRQGQTPV